MHCVGVFNCSQSRIYCYRLRDRHHENVLVTQKLLNVKISTVGVQNEVSVKMCFDMMVSSIVFAKVLFVCTGEELASDVKSSLCGCSLLLEAFTVLF